MPVDLFDDLVASIIYQQLSGKAASRIHDRFLDLFDGAGRALPGPLSAMDVETLRSVGLSRQKAAYVTDLARRVHEGVLPIDHLHELSDEEVHSHLTQVKGIGPWTADMMLIFSLHRPNVFPTLDLGVKRGLQKVSGIEEDIKPDAMLALAERWQPHRSASSLALWKALET
jgi:DNA-3-methyladenine glycosylase II